MRTIFTFILMAVCAICNAQGLQKMNPNKKVYDQTTMVKHPAVAVKKAATPKVVEQALAKKAAVKKVGKAPKKTAYNQGPMICDSIVFYGTEGVTDKTVYYYNESGVETHEITYMLQDGEWIPTGKEEVEFDQYGNVVVDASYYWEDGAWVASSKNEETFDANGNETSYKYYNPDENGEWKMTYKDWTTIDQYGYTSAYESYWLDEDTNIWMGSDKWEQTNTPVDGHYTYHMSWEWDWDNNVWKNSYKQIAEYTCDDNVELSWAVYLWEDEAWVGDYKEEFTYNDDYNYLSSLYYKWADGDWTYDSKYEFEYDQWGNQVVQANYNFEDGEWVPNFKEVYEFDEQGNLTSDVSYFGNSTTKEWDLYSTYKYINTYDENNRLACSVMYVIEDDMRYDQSKEEFTYNEAGKVLTDISYTWNSETGEWEYGMKYENDYDENGYQTLNATYYWSSDGWYGTGKSELSYDAEGNVLTSAYYDWDWTENDWTGWNKYVYTYDEAGNQTSSTSYGYSLGEWIAENKEVYTFNERGEITEYVNYIREDGEWVPTYKEAKEWDEYDNLLSEGNYSYENGEWIMTWEAVYFYHNTTEDAINDITTGNNTAASCRNKAIVNGKLVITDAEGRQFNAAGAQMK